MGPTVFAKELTRAILFQRRSDYTIGELIGAGLLCRSPKRPSNRLTSHKGFDFRVLKGALMADFVPVAWHYSPLPWLPFWLNSQVFLVLKPRVR